MTHGTRPCVEATSAPSTPTISCLGDLDANGAVDAADLGMLLAAWGTNETIADLDNDGVVGTSDLAALFAAWGGCA